MQKPISVVNFSSPSPSPSAPARGKNAGPDQDGASFNQALSREVAQRQQPAAPAKTEPAPKPGAAKAAEKATPPKQAAGAEQARKADVREKQKDAADAATEAAAAAADGSVNPVVDMLALVASFNQPQQAAQLASDKLAPTGRGKDMESQLAALQGAPGKAQGAMPVLEGEALPAQGTQDGKFFNMMARMDSTAVDDADAGFEPPSGLFSRTMAAAVEPQARASADAAAALARSTFDPAQSVRRDDSFKTALAEVPVSAPLTTAVQQASLAMTQAVNAASDKIPARVGTPGWDNQVAQKIIYMVGGEEMSASLTLNPPDLGPMQVVLNVNNDHADVMFSSAQPEVRQALEDALPKLREMMSESGISLGNASVDDGARQQAQDEPARGTRGTGQASTNGSAAEAEAQLAARPLRVGELPGLVNTFA